MKNSFEWVNGIADNYAKDMLNISNDKKLKSVGTLTEEKQNHLIKKSMHMYFNTLNILMEYLC